MERQGSAVKSMRNLLMGLTVAVLSSCASQEPLTYSKAQGRIYYTKANIWYANPARILSISYHQGSLIPVGARVKVLSCKGTTLQFITDSGVLCSVLAAKKYDKSAVEDLFGSWFSEDDIMAPGARFDRFSPEEQENILKGAIGSGMSKEAVIMAYGYPPSVKTPSIEADTWTYWVGSSKRTVLTFRDGYLQEIDGKATVRTVRVYAVSEPPGATVDVDGQLQGRTPCVLALNLEPEKMTQVQMIRASPAEPDYPRLGVVCGVPAGGTVLGELITIADVLPTSTAQRLGIQPGDRIMSINGKLVRSEQECFDIVKSIGFGGAINVQVQRGSSETRLQGQFDTPPKGVFYSQEKKMTGAELARLHRKILRFDMRAGSAEKPVTNPTDRTDPADRTKSAAPAKAVEPEPAKEQGIAIAGSGFVVGKGGYVLTGVHLLGGANTASVRGPGGTWHPATMVKADVVNDWCLLKAPALAADPMPMAPDESFAKGSKVYCAGYPVQESARRNLAAPEVKCGTLMEAAGLEGDRRHIQVMLPSSQGLSGSAIVDDQGRWMGMLSDRLDGVIQAVAPKGTVASGMRFVLKASLIRTGLPAEVELVSSPAGDAGTHLDADGIQKRVKSAVVMIQVKGN